MAKPIYLDYNGTTPHDPEVIEAMRPFLEHSFGNPSSSHWYGIEPKRLATISYGKERPLDTRSNAEAWAKNRRAAFVITNQ